MDRFAIFVDAGYLYAAGGNLVHGTADRLRLELHFEETVSALVRMAHDHSEIRYLRTYWYDGAIDGRPAPSHLAIASIPGVKLRLGQLRFGRQKGVDSRLVRDLIVLARDHAIAAAYVLSGDEDIREGVAEAQDQGLSVVLLGIASASSEPNQARSLVQEADDVIQLTRAQITPWIDLRDSSAQTTAEVSGPSIDSGTGYREVGREFARTWAESHSMEVSQTLLDRPRIPREVDRELLAYAKERGRFLTEDEKRSLRNGFWAALGEAETS